METAFSPSFTKWRARMIWPEKSPWSHISRSSSETARLEGINYVADTLLFAGIVLLAAAIMPGGASQPGVSRDEVPAPPSRAQ